MAKLYFKVGSDWEEVVRLRNEIVKLKQELKSMDGTQSPAAFKALNTQLSASTQQMDELVTNAVKAGAIIEGDFKKKIFDASQTVNGFTERIITQKAVVKDIEADAKRLGEAYHTALKRNPLSASGKLEEYNSARKALDEEKAALFGLTQEQANARLSVKKLRDEYSLYKNDGKQVVETNQNIGLSLGKALGVIGGFAALKQLGSEIIRVRGEFQSMQTAIETMIGKDMAGQLIPQIKELAKISPLTMSDMVGAEKMMLGFNIQADDTIKYLKALSDISMGESSKFNSLTLAFSQMSATGKLMGQDLNQMINAGFNPLQTISEKTGKSIATLKDEMSKGAISAEMVQQAFIDATSAGGKFYNMSENASKTINGQLSMMQDALDSVFNELGTKGEGVIMKGIQMTTSLIENYETIGNILAGLVVTYGAYRTAVMLVTAAESKHTLVEIGLTNVRVLARKAQLALNASMLANPYVLLATAVVGLGVAMWAFHDSATEAERAQKKFNKQQEEAAKQEQEHKQKIDSLVDSSRDIALADLQRGQSLSELRKEYPKIFAKYDIETIKLADILKLKRQIAEEDAKRAGEKKAKEFSNIEEEIKYYENLLKSLSGQQGVDGYVKKLQQLRLDRDVILQERGKGISEQFISNLKDVDISEFDQYISELEKRIKGKGENGNVKLRLPIDVKGSLSDEAIYNVKDIKMLIDTAKAAKKTKEEARKAEKKSSAEWLADYKKAYDDAEKAYKNFLSSKQVMSDADRDKELKKLKGLRDVAKATYESKGGSTSSDTKEENQVRKQQESIRQQQEKYDLLMNKQKLDQKRQAEDLANQQTQSEIDIEKDAFKKIQAQRKLDNEKEIQALERQKEDYIRSVIQAKKEEFDAKEDTRKAEKPKYIKKTFDPSTVTVDTSVWDKIINNTSKKQKNDQLQKQEDSWDEYLIKYGTFQSKKEVLDRKYQQLIKEAPDAGKAAILQKEWDEAIANLKLDKLKTEINWEVVFGDVSKITKKQLQEVKKQLAEFKKSPEFKNATPEQIKVIEEAVNNINNALVDKGGFFGGLGESLDEYKQKVEEAKKAQEEYDKALKTGNNALIEKATTNKNAADKNLINAQTNVEKSKDKAVSNINAVSNAIVQLGKENISLTDIGNTVGTLVDTLSQSGSKIGGIISAILSVIDAAGEVGTFQYGLDIIENVSSTVTDAFARDTEAITGIDMSFMRGADYDDYNEMVAKYDTLLDVWDQLLDKKKAYIKESYGIEATKVGQEALDLLNSERKITRELASSRLDAGASAGSHSMSSRMWKGSYNYEGTKWKDVAGQISKALGGIDFSSMWSMLDMSAEQLEWIKINYSGLWASMDGDFRGYLDDIIQYGDTEKEIIKSINEQLTQTSFDSVFDSFVNTLMDMDASSKDFADNFEEYMRKAIFTSMFAKNYEDELTEWYKAFATANKKEGGITADDVKNLKTRWDGIVDGALSDREAWEEIVGSSGSSSQDSTKKGFAAASQDSVEELNGRFTALQIAGEEIKDQNIIQSQSLNLLTAKADAIFSVNTETRNIADNTRDLIANSYLELVQISENTGAIVKPIQQMQKDMAEVKNNTKGLSSK